MAGGYAQMMERVLERAGQELFRQIDRQKSRMGIDVLVPRHAKSPTER